MKIIKRLINGFSLQKMADAPDGSASAINNTEQQISGDKTFLDGLKVGKDVSAGAKTLIRKDDLDSAVLRVPHERFDEILLTAEMLADKKVTLRAGVTEGSEDAVKMTTDGSVEMYSNVWFEVSGNILSWENFPNTSAVLIAGYKIYVRYVGL